MKKLIKIEGMSCKHCSARVFDALSSLVGNDVKVDLEKGEALIVSENAISEQAIKQAIEDVGFDVLSINDL